MMRETNIKQGKRDMIIDAAVKIFSGKGYHNTRMEEIAAAAGIGKGTIYEYFPGKLQLFQEMLRAGLSQYYKSLSRGRPGEITFAQRIEILAEAHIDFCQANKDLARILFWDAQTIDEDLRDWSLEIRQEKEQRMLELIEEGISQGEIKELNARLLSLTVLGFLSSFWIPIVIEGWEVNSRQLAREFTDLIMNGIKK